MTASDIITPARKMLADETATYRWANTTLWDQWGTEGMQDIWEKRPDARFTSAGVYTTSLTLPVCSGETLPTTTLDLQGVWRKALTDYVCYRAFSQDADDVQNLQRAAGHKLLYDAALAGG